MVYIWSDHESIDELKHKLLCTNFELESAKMMAKEEVSKNEEIINQLFQLFKVACQERDEARNQLQKLVIELMPSTPADQTITTPILSQVNNENPIPQKPTNPPMLKESDFVPQPLNSHLFGSYPTSYSYGSIPFQGLPNANFADSNSFGLPKKPVDQEFGSKFDCASVIMDNIARVRPLPKKGRLVQAVMETGPLLQTLLVAPLPKWKNPPPIPPLQSPPSLIYGSEVEAVDLIHATQSSSSGTSASFLESSTGFSHIPSLSVLNFERGSACLNNGLQLHVGNNNKDAMQYQIATSKRRRF